MLPIALLSKKNLTSRLAILPGFLLLRGEPPPSKSTSLSDSMEGPLDLLPRIQQSYWTSMGATGWMAGLSQLQQ
jgi:hypothetical protein